MKYRVDLGKDGGSSFHLHSYAPCFKIRDWQGFGEKISLHHITMGFAQKINLFLVFDAFRYRMNPEFIRKINKAGDNALSLIVRYILEELAVELDGIHVELLEQSQ